MTLLRPRTSQGERPTKWALGPEIAIVLLRYGKETNVAVKTYHGLEYLDFRAELLADANAAAALRVENERLKAKLATVQRGVELFGEMEVLP